MEKLTRTALDSQVVPDKEKAELRVALSRVKLAHDWFSKWVVEPIQEHDPAKAAYIYEHIAQLLSSALIIGSTATVSYAAQNFADRERAKFARSANTAARARLESAVLTVIADPRFGGRFAASEKFAREIRPRVLESLDISEETENSRWPKIRTITDVLCTIKKSRP
jgi:hypothetical protein